MNRAERRKAKKNKGNLMQQLNGLKNIKWFYTIPRPFVESCDVESVLEHMKQKGGYDGEMLVSFDGYGEDKRELCEIPEVIDFSKKLIETHPEIILKWDYETLKLFVLITAAKIKEKDFKNQNVEHEVDMEEFKRLFFNTIKSNSMKITNEHLGMLHNFTNEVCNIK